MLDAVREGSAIQQTPDDAGSARCRFAGAAHPVAVNQPDLSRGQARERYRLGI